MTRETKLFLLFMKERRREKLSQGEISIPYVDPTKLCGVGARVED